MDQLDHVTSVIVITVSNIIRNLIIIMDFPHERKVKKSAKKVSLVRKIYFSYSFFNNFGYCNCNHRRHVVQVIHGLKGMWYLVN